MKIHEILEDVLADMTRAAANQGIPGAAVVGYLPEKDSLQWVTLSRLTGALVRPESESAKAANFYAIAHAKAGVMMATLEDSGDPAHALRIGEVPYRGGAIAPFGAGYVLAAFSGGTSDEDYAISKRGVARLMEALS